MALTPTRWEDGPTHVVFAHCKNKQGPEEGALKGLHEMMTKREKKKQKKLKAKQRRQGQKANAKRKLPSNLVQEQQAATSAKGSKSKKARAADDQPKQRAGAEVEFVFKMRAWTPYKSSIEEVAERVLKAMTKCCQDRASCNISRETSTMTSLR